MPRLPNVSMKATNQLLEHIAACHAAGDHVESGQDFAARANVGRAVARSAFARLEAIGVLRRDGRRRFVARMPLPGDFHMTDQTESRPDLVRRRFLELTLNGGLLPGQLFRESDVARAFGASTVSVREFLIGFARYGLVEKTAGGGWRFCPFDAPFALELAAVRKLFEHDAIRRFAAFGEGDPVWSELDGLLARHRAMRAGGPEQIRQFPALDREFHRFVIRNLANRFVDDIYDVMSFVFHYHYQWRRDEQVARNIDALDEHIEIAVALQARDFGGAAAALERHLSTSVRTLLDAAMPI